MSQADYLQKLVTFVVTQAANTTSTLPASQVVVSICFLIVKTLQLSSGGVLDITGAFALSWTDSRLAWNPQAFNRLYTAAVPSTSIWIPQIVLINSASKDFAVAAPSSTSNAYLFYDGTATFFTPKKLSATCSMDLSKFPFDSQTCTLLLVSFDSAINNLPAVYFREISREVIRDLYSDTGEFSLTSSSIVTSGKNSTVCAVTNCFTSVQISLHYVRRTSYYIWNLLIPASALIITMPFAFLLPSENSVKVSMTCSLMVALYVLQQNVSRLLPASAVWSLCGVGTCAAVIIGCFAAVVSIILVTVRIYMPACGERCGECLSKLFSLVSRSSRVVDPMPANSTMQGVELADAKSTEIGTKNLLENNQQADQNLQVLLLQKIVFLLEKQANCQQADVNHSHLTVARVNNWKRLDMVANGVMFLCFLLAAGLTMLFLEFQVLT